MPEYEYECECGCYFTRLIPQYIGADEQKCPRCSMLAKKIISAPALVRVQLDDFPAIDKGARDDEGNHIELER